MYEFSSQANIIIQALIAVILIGAFYNLWISTRAYGGIIGAAVRLLGIGMLFITISVIEHVLINFKVIQTSVNLGLAQDIMTIIGLALLSLGFSKLASATKV